MTYIFSFQILHSLLTLHLGLFVDFLPFLPLLTKPVPLCHLCPNLNPIPISVSLPSFSPTRPFFRRSRSTTALCQPLPATASSCSSLCRTPEPPECAQSCPQMPYPDPWLHFPPACCTSYTPANYFCSWPAAPQASAANLESEQDKAGPSSHKVVKNGILEGKSFSKRVMFFHEVVTEDMYTGFSNL